MIAQKLSLGLLSLLLICSSSGCELGRTVFQMSSDSPVPMFSFNLLPTSKKKSSVTGIDFRPMKEQTPVVSYQHSTEVNAIPITTQVANEGRKKRTSPPAKSSSIEIALPFWKSDQSSLLDEEGTPLDY